jgi:hypothetical protein
MKNMKQRSFRLIGHSLNLGILLSWRLTLYQGPNESGEGYLCCHLQICTLEHSQSEDSIYVLNRSDISLLIRLMVSPSLGLKYNMIDMARNQYLYSTLNIFTENHELKILHLYQVSWFCMKKIIVNLSCCEGEYSLVICHPCILVSSPCIDTIYVGYRGTLGLRHEIITFERTSHSSSWTPLYVCSQFISNNLDWTNLGLQS